MLDVVDQSVGQLATATSSGAGRPSETRDCILRAIVILGWLYSQLDKYMDMLRDEQRENQEFVDWALFVIDDLHWQNEGSRRLGNDAHNDDADDGARPVRPEFDYALLLGFIRQAFRRPQGEGTDAPKVMPSILDGSQGDGGSAGTLAGEYFDLLVERAHLGALRKTASQMVPATEGSSSGAAFQYVFHSRELLEAAVARCQAAGHASDIGATAAAPSYKHALGRVRSLVSRAFKWPAHILGSGLKWRAEPIATAPLLLEADGDAPGLLSDMHYVTGSANDSGVQGAMFVASTSQAGRFMMITSTVAADKGNTSIARVELVVD
ncbi:hypothetical protein LPJ61_006760, partial [Coemansia biformis]